MTDQTISDQWQNKYSKLVTKAITKVSFIQVFTSVNDQPQTQIIITFYKIHLHLKSHRSIKVGKDH